MQRDFLTYLIAVLFLIVPADAAAGSDGEQSADASSRRRSGAVTQRDPEIRPNANGPLRLGSDQESTDPEAASPALQDDGPPAEKPAPPEDQSVAAEPPSVADPRFDAPAVDPRPLGTPNGAFSARPATGETDDAEAGEESWMGSLDPRRNDFMRVLGALAIVIGLLLLIRLAMKRAPGLGGGFRPSGVVEVLARYPVGRGQQLVILKLARRIILLHHAGNVMRTLTEIDDPNEVAALLGRMESGASGRGKAVFKSVLGRFQEEHDRLQRERRTRNQHWAGDMDSGELVDLTRRAGGNGNARTSRSEVQPARNQVVTRKRSLRRLLSRR